MSQNFIVRLPYIVLSYLHNGLKCITIHNFYTDIKLGVGVIRFVKAKHEICMNASVHFSRFLVNVLCIFCTYFGGGAVLIVLPLHL